MGVVKRNYSMVNRVGKKKKKTALNKDNHAYWENGFSELTVG